MREIPYEEWYNEGLRLFGPDKKTWRFICPSCGFSQCINDFLAIGVPEPEKSVFFSCIGRYMGSEGTIFNKKSPCNYTSGGLFKLTETIVNLNGDRIPVFEFDKESEEW